MKKLFLITAFISTGLSLEAQQKKNNLQIQVLGNYAPTKEYSDFSFYPMNGIGIQYERRINKGFGIALKYSQWTNQDLMKALERPLFRENFIVPGTGEKNDGGGVLTTYSGYRFFDLSGTYTRELNKWHRFTFRQGLSYTTGQNEYIYPTDVFVPTHTLRSELETGKHFGGVTDISYDYLFWKQRINIGINIGVRYYVGLPWINYTGGMHLGFNF
jgi:hypothetical protein